MTDSAQQSKGFYFLLFFFLLAQLQVVTPSLQCWGTFPTGINDQIKENWPQHVDQENDALEAQIKWLWKGFCQLK